MLILALTVFCLPFAIRIAMARLAGLDTWAAQRRIFAKSHRCVSYDLRGQTFHTMLKADALTGQGIDPFQNRLVTLLADDDILRSERRGRRARWHLTEPGERGPRPAICTLRRGGGTSSTAVHTTTWAPSTGEAIALTIVRSAGVPATAIAGASTAGASSSASTAGTISSPAGSIHSRRLPPNMGKALASSASRAGSVRSEAALSECFSAASPARSLAARALDPDSSAP